MAQRRVRPHFPCRRRSRSIFRLRDVKRPCPNPQVVLCPHHPRGGNGDDGENGCASKEFPHSLLLELPNRYCRITDSLSEEMKEHTSDELLPSAGASRFERREDSLDGWPGRPVGEWIGCPTRRVYVWGF